MILWRLKSNLDNYSYSSDHRPDKKQITFDIAEISNPINIPIRLTIKSGNINDQTHFLDTFDQVKDKLKPNSRIIFDKGANSKKNLDPIIAKNMKYLTAKKLNKSNDKSIKKF